MKLMVTVKTTDEHGNEACGVKVFGQFKAFNSQKEDEWLVKTKAVEAFRDAVYAGNLYQPRKTDA